MSFTIAQNSTALLTNITLSGGGFNPPAVTGISPNTGPAAGGTVVTITGTSLAGATAVTFGTTAAASFTVVNATTITATSPAGTGTVDIAVTAPAGTSTPSAASKFAYASPTTTTTVTSSQNPSAFGQSVTFTATVTGSGGAPTGTVTFKDGANTLGSPVALNGAGQATFTTSALSAGSHTITAVYSGDSNYATSTSAPLAQDVNQNTTTASLISSKNPSTFGEAVTFTATIVNSGGTPTGTVTFKDGASTLGSPVALNGAGQATFTTSALSAGDHTVTAVYSGDSNYATSTSAPLTQAVNQNTTTTTLISSKNPSTFGEAVTFTATIVGSGGTPTGTVTFKDGGTVIGTNALAGGTASFTTTSLTHGAHNMTASYGGSTNFAPSTSSVLVQTVNIPTDSVRLRALQVGATKLIAQGSGQAISNAIDGAITEGFSDGGQLISPLGNGLHFNFAAEAPASHGDGADDSGAAVQHASTAYDPTSPVSAFAAEQRPRARVGDAFAAFDRRVPTKAPAFVPSPPRDWVLWANVSGFGVDRWQQNAPLTGNQLNALLGLTRKVSPTFIIGVFGGYETFDYASQPYNGRLTGDGWTVGSYLGWKFMPGLRFDLGAAYSGIGYDGVSGAATGNFNGNRWLLSGGLTGTGLKGAAWAYGFNIEPSAKVYALWERENAYTDSLGTPQAERTFVTGRASGGIKVAYPFLDGSVLTMTPYAGLYADYYFTGDDAANSWETPPLASFPLLDGWSARATGGLSVSFANGAHIAFGGELGGIGADAALWTYRVRARVPF